MRNLLTLSASLFAATCLVACGSDSQAGEDVSAPANAVCVLTPVGDSGVTGTIRFERTEDGLRVTGTVNGLSEGEHGFHVHEFGDITDAAEGKSAGSHYAPRGNPHGRPSDEQRHVGDLGNIVADADGTATVDMTDSVIALGGQHSILGRSIVVHAGADQFTQPVGDAGPRVAFGVIGVAQQ